MSIIYLRPEQILKLGKEPNISGKAFSLHDLSKKFFSNEKQILTTHGIIMIIPGFFIILPSAFSSFFLFNFFSRIGNVPGTPKNFKEIDHG